MQFHGIRNDQHGARGDYIFVADAAEYAEKLQRLHQQHLQGLQQQPAPAQQPTYKPQHMPDMSAQDRQHQVPSISLFSALSSACILRVSFCLNVASTQAIVSTFVLEYPLWHMVRPLCSCHRLRFAISTADAEQVF